MIEQPLHFEPHNPSIPREVDESFGAVLQRLEALTEDVKIAVMEISLDPNHPEALAKIDDAKKIVSDLEHVMAQHTLRHLDDQRRNL